MSKKVYITLEVIKVCLIYYFINLVYHASFGGHSGNQALPIIGTVALSMLATSIISSIATDILFSFFIPREKNSAGEWERFVNQNVLRSFAYALSLFFLVLMASFTLNFSLHQVLLVLRIGFFILIAVQGLTKSYYYVG